MGLPEVVGTVRQVHCSRRRLLRRGLKFHVRTKRLINISHDKSWTWLRKGSFKRKTEFLLLPMQNYAIRTNHIKARIDKTQQNRKCRLCCDRDEPINHIISECSKLALKEYKTTHNWVVPFWDFSQFAVTDLKWGLIQDLLL